MKEAVLILLLLWW